MSEIKKESMPSTKMSAVESARGAERPSLGELFLAGPVLSICSPSFYRQAVKRSTFAALAFFVVFGLLIAVVQTVRATASFGEARTAIDEAFASGEIPEVIVEDGVATVNAEQPFVAVDDGHSLVVLDTTGVYTGQELAAGGYESGMILTRDTVYSVDDEGQYHETALADVERLIPFRIHINANLLQRFIDLTQAFVFFGLFVWNGILRPFYIILLALGVWGAASLIRGGINFSAVLITGFFAAIPAMYVEYLLDQINGDVFLLFTLALLIIWTLALVAAVGRRRDGDLLRGERPLRAWRALIGAPMLLVFALDIMLNWERGAIITWVVALLTIAALGLVGYYSGLRAAPPETPGKIAPQG